MNRSTFYPNRIVRAHADVLCPDGWAGFVRHLGRGEWEFHRDTDSLDADLRPVPLGSLLERDPTLNRLASMPPMTMAWRWERGDGFQMRRVAMGPTFFFELKVSPGENHPRRKQLGGAFVNAWVRIETEAEARVIVLEELSKLHWDVVSIRSEHCSAADFERSESIEGFMYFTQVQLDGEVFEIHEYPPDTAEES